MAEAYEEIEKIINSAFENPDDISPDMTGEKRDAIEAAMSFLDNGTLRVAEKNEGEWHVNQWLKKAVLLSFRLNNMTTIAHGPGTASWWDKVPSKFDGWGAEDFSSAGFRAVPNCVVRRGAYIAPNVVLMPSFVILVPMLMKAPWLIHGRRLVLALKLVRMSISLVAQALVVYWNPYKPTRQLLKIIALSGRAPKLRKA